MSALREELAYPATPTRFAMRFTVWAALTAIAFAGLAWFVGDRVSGNRVGAIARARAQFIADSVLAPRLRPRDLDGLLQAARIRQLDVVFRREVLLDGVTSASVAGQSGRVVYSTDHALIGGLMAAQHAPAGTVDGVVPVDVGESGVGAELRVRQQSASIPGSDGSIMIPLTIVIGLTLIGLLVAVVPDLRRIARRGDDQAKRAEQIEHQAFHDGLTGLANRALFHDRVKQALTQAQRDNEVVAVMLMDLDRFKEINDTFGHHSGDHVLAEVAAHLRKAVRATDTVARLGGDEFAILAPRIAGPAGAIALAERALEEVQRSHRVSGVDVDVDASVGIALSPHHGQDVDALLRCADIAMYVSKSSGAGPMLYGIEHDHHSAERLALGAQLRHAIARGEIVVYYQPKADFDTGAVTGVEALVRWQHPERGLLPPDEFVPLAEQTGLIRPLTSLVLDTALGQCRAWSELGLRISVAVNITGRDLLDQRFAEEVKDLLRKWAVLPSRLELEITENTVFTDPVRAQSVLLALKDLGVRLAIDDFGSGNSSLGYLKRLPIDVLKIDKSFVLQMESNAEDATIVRSTIDLGHNLGLKVVAEGVSSITAWKRLRQLGCDTAQGYYLSRPVPGPEIPKMIPEANRFPRLGAAS